MTKHTNKSEEYFSAIAGNDLNKIQELVLSGVSQLQSQADDDNFGSYPIHVAARYGSLEIVKCLRFELRAEFPA